MRQRLGRKGMLRVCHPQQPQAASGISYGIQANEMPYALAAQGLGMTDATREMDRKIKDQIMSNNQWRPIFCLFSTLCLAAPAGQSQTAVDSAAQRLRRLIEITPAVRSVADEEIKLPMGEVFAQGSTNWCWAYSTFHTTRTYYLNTPVLSSEAFAWRNALQDVNTPAAFRSFVGRRHDTSQTGHPEGFVSDMQEDGVPSQPWVGLVPANRRDLPVVSDGGFSPAAIGDQYLPKAEILKIVRDNLQRGIGSSWCGQGHCISIYGIKVNGDQPTAYHIADSASSSPTYEASPSRIHQYLELIFTMKE